jgi:RNA recognition motif-containing protein
MGKKLYVGNLSFSTTDQQLSDYFSEHGTVDSAKIIMDRDTNRSKGFAFVEMSTDDEAQAAIAALDGAEVDGRALKVNEAKPMEPRENRGSFGGQSRGGRSNRY